MDILKYEAFLNVVDRGSLSQSADDLGYTRSALSKMISSMEKEIGFPLVKRTKYGVELNEEGERVLPLIRNLVRANYALEEEYSMIRGFASGKIRIGCFPSLAYMMMADILTEFHENYPNVQMEVVEEHSLPQIESWLRKGIIDVAFISKEPYHDYYWVDVMEDPYVVLLPAVHPLEEKEVVPVKELFRHRLILFKTHEGYDQDMVKFADLMVSQKEPEYTTNSINLVEKMVVKDRCAAIVSLSMAKNAARLYPVIYRSLDRKVVRELGFAVKDRENLSPMVKQFLQYLKKI